MGQFPRWTTLTGSGPEAARFVIYPDREPHTEPVSFPHAVSNACFFLYGWILQDGEAKKEEIGRVMRYLADAAPGQSLRMVKWGRRNRLMPTGRPGEVMEGWERYAERTVLILRTFDGEE